MPASDDVGIRQSRALVRELLEDSTNLDDLQKNLMNLDEKVRRLSEYGQHIIRTRTDPGSKRQAQRTFESVKDAADAFSIYVTATDRHNFADYLIGRIQVGRLVREALRDLDDYISNLSLPYTDTSPLSQQRRPAVTIRIPIDSIDDHCA